MPNSPLIPSPDAVKFNRPICPHQPQLPRRKALISPVRGPPCRRFRRATVENLAPTITRPPLQTGIAAEFAATSADFNGNRGVSFAFFVPAIFMGWACVRPDKADRTF